jgi:MinD superfamily P-loop ATPase
MIRVAVLSGKGGTGKTVVAVALATLMGPSLILADCDVDASNLELLLNPRCMRVEEFRGGQIARIDPDLCVGCGACADACRFGAILPQEPAYGVVPHRCEGCGVCTQVCPALAVALEPRVTGEIRVSATRYGTLVHARLLPGCGNSGLLVHEVKRIALQEGKDCRYLLMDGPPGTGCPVISTLAGADMVVLVTEPSISALHDLRRVVMVARGGGRRLSAVINRWDLDPKQSGDVGKYCREEGIPVLGRIPFDFTVMESVRRGEPVTLWQSPASEEMGRIWRGLSAQLADSDATDVPR